MTNRPPALLDSTGCTARGHVHRGSMRCLPSALLLAVAGLFVSTAFAGLEFAATTVEAAGKAGEEVIVAEFPFKNTGSTPVSIDQVTSSCGCTVPELAKKDYAPGEQGKIVAKFTVGDRQGPQSKTITVRTADESHVLRLKADLPIRVTAVPRLVVFREGETEAKTIKVSFGADAPVKLAGIESLSPSFVVEARTVNDGREYTVSITPAPGLSEAERGNIRVRTVGASGREYTDMLYARFAP